MLVQPRKPTVPSTTKVLPTVSNVNRPVVPNAAPKPVVATPQPIAAPRIAPRSAPMIPNAQPFVKPEPAPTAADTQTMIEQTNSPLAVQTGGQLALPDYMKDFAGQGTEELAQYVMPPRLKIIQALSDSQMKQTLGVGDGDILVTPMNLLLARLERDNGGNAMYDSAQPIVVTPIFFWKEWCQWNDVNLRGTPGERPVIQKSLDPTSEVARKATNKNTYEEPHPRFADMKLHNVEHLCFLVFLHNVDEVDTPVILSFDRGSHVAGRQACQLIKLRRAPIWGNILGVKAVQRNWQNNQWPGMDLVTLSPEVAPPFIPAENVEFFKNMHEEFKKLHEERALTGIDEGGGDETPQVTDEVGASAGM